MYVILKKNPGHYFAPLRSAKALVTLRNTLKRITERIFFKGGFTISLESKE